MSLKIQSFAQQKNFVFLEKYDPDSQPKTLRKSILKAPKFEKTCRISPIELNFKTSVIFNSHDNKFPFSKTHAMFYMLATTFVKYFQIIS